MNYADVMVELRAQRRRFEIEGPMAHNRRGGILTMRRIRVRRWRREWHRRLYAMTATRWETTMATGNG